MSLSLRRISRRSRLVAVCTSGRSHRPRSSRWALRSRPSARKCSLWLAGAWLCSGKAVFLIDVDPVQGLTLAPSSSWDVQGGVLERDWIYRLDMIGPSGSRTVTRPAASVLHFRIGADSRAPWRGRPAAPEKPGDGQPRRVDRGPADGRVEIADGSDRASCRAQASKSKRLAR